MVEVLASAEILRRATPDQPLSLTKRRHLLAFAALAGIVGPAIGTTGAATWLVLRSDLRFSATRPTLRGFTAARPGGELAALAVVSAAAAYVRYAESPYPLGFLAIPVFIWGAFRFGIFGCSLAVAIYATITAWMTVHGHGLIAGIDTLDPTARVQYIQMALATVVLSMLGVAHVVAQRERYAKGLEESEVRLRAIVDHAHDAYVAMDYDGRIIMWSPQAEQALGWPAEEVLGHQLAETIIPPQRRDDHYRVYGAS